MKKALIVGMIGSVALVAIATKTNVWSYAGTLISQVSQEASNQIPAKFEIERIRHEISALDKDIAQMVRPIAEYKVTIEQLRKDIARKQTNIEEQKATLLAVCEELKGNPKTMKYAHRVFTAAQVRHQLNRDTDGLKHLEKCVRTQEQVLAAKENAFKATQEQLAKVISKKREYQVRLAQLEAQEETLRIAEIGTETKFDNSRATQIEEALKKLEHNLQVRETALQINNGELVNVPLNDRTPEGPVDLNAIRDYLQGAPAAPAPTKTASTK